ncbi:MAG: hypothetical protein H6704_28220 [Myxococcales bacterium]|nr:hypothetical protein [Myxococcales bacterium]
MVRVSGDEPRGRRGFGVRGGAAWVVLLAYGLVGCGDDSRPVDDGEGYWANAGDGGAEPEPAERPSCLRSPQARRLSDIDNLGRLLATACPGDRLHLDGRTWMGDFQVPAGVTLEEGLLVGDVRLGLATEGPVTTLDQVQIVGSLYAEGGRLVLRSVAVDPRRPVAIHLVDVDSVWEQESFVVPHGLILDRDPWPPPVGVTDEDIALGPWLVAGVLIEGGTAEGGLVDISRPVGFGLALRGVTARFERVAVESFVGTAVFVEGGSLGVERAYIWSDVDRRDHLRERPGHGLVGVDGAEIGVREAEIELGRGVGVLQIGATGVYSGLALSSFGPAIWVQDAPEGPALALDLADSDIEVRGGPAQMVLRAAGDVRVRDTRFDNPTCCALQTPDANEADGLQIVAPNGLLDLRGVLISGFGRAGLLIDGEDADQPTFAFADVTLQPGDPGALGLHVQGLADVPVEGIERTPDLERADDAAEGRTLDPAPAQAALDVGLLP